MADNELKRQLPHPYDQDLSGVLKHLNRRTSFGRDKLANDPTTASYLAAALRLVQRNLGPSPDRELTDPDDEGALRRPMLGYLSQRAVAAELEANPRPFYNAGGVAGLRDRWRSQSDFIADVIRFAMWIGNHPEGYSDVVAAGTERLLDGPDMVEAAHELAYANIRDALGLPSQRLCFAAMVGAEGDPTVAEAVADSYRSYLEPWKEVYSTFMQARNLRLRPGVSIDDIANLLAAVVDGVALRSIGNPSTDLVDPERQRSLLGTAALAVVYSFMERVEDPDCATLEDAVRAKVYRNETAP